MSGSPIDPERISIEDMPAGTFVHNIELTPGKGGQIARGAGTAAIVSSSEGGYVFLKMPSTEVRRVQASAMATVGQVGNTDWKNEVIGKAGRARNMGRRPTVRVSNA